MIKLDNFQHYVLGQIFTCYPDDLTYQEICDLCMDEEALEAYNERMEADEKYGECLELCEAYEYHLSSHIPDIMNDMIRSLKCYFDEKKEI